MKKTISFIFPFYNEEQSIDAFKGALEPVFTEIEKKYDLEIICVNDGSKDATLEKLIEFHETDDRFQIINFSRNFGHEMAMMAGLDYSTGEAVIVMDSDLQDPPAVCLEFIQKWEEGYEVVYGQRQVRKDTAFKKFTAHAFYRVLDKLADIKIPKDTGNFRLMDRKVVDTLKNFREKNRFMRGLVSYVGFKQTAVLFDRAERFAGETHYPLKKMIKLALDGITSFSTVPLRIITQIGFVVSFLSVLSVVYVLFVKLVFDHAIPGWTTIVLPILFFGGLQMIMLGILGTYIGRIYNEVQDRPLYIVSSVFSRKKETESRN
jgi:glycosyltransferase involved in cell wall biosynthesis